MHANDEEVFIWSCLSGKIEVAKWLCSLCDEYYIKIENNEIVNYGIKNMYDNFLDKKRRLFLIIRKLENNNNKKSLKSTFEKY
jgi:hypothetical protein